LNASTYELTLIIDSYAIIALAFYIYPDNVQGDPTGNGLVTRFFAAN
jgi:hypothetical protein